MTLSDISVKPPLMFYFGRTPSSTWLHFFHGIPFVSCVSLSQSSIPGAPTSLLLDKRMLDIQNQRFLGVVVATLEAQLSHLSNMSTSTTMTRNKHQWPLHKDIELHILLVDFLGVPKFEYSLKVLHILHREFRFFHLPLQKITRLRHAIDSGHHSSISTTITPKSASNIVSSSMVFYPAYLREMPVLNSQKWPHGK